MVGRKGSVDRLLWDEFNFIPTGERPRYDSPEWDKWLDEFAKRHMDVVIRMREPLKIRALYVLKYVIPDYFD